MDESSGSILTREQMVAAAEAAHSSKILRDLGAPDPTVATKPSSQALFTLHLAAVYHRLMIIVDVLRFYARAAELGEGEYPPLALARDTPRGHRPSDTAEALYQIAIDLDPALAEAHYGFGRLSKVLGKSERALAEFDKCLALSPHGRASPHAFIRGNAKWERATIFEHLGRDREALEAYRAALRSLPSFGVHHVRAARFLRRLGHVDEALAEFGKCMVYSHRYFDEFMLPALVDASPAQGPRPLSPIYETSAGDVIVFWQGEYYAVSSSRWTSLGEEPSALPLNLLNNSRKASSIAALEV